MGLLFTYMVKAAHRELLTGDYPSREHLASYRAMMGIPEQPIPTYEYFTPLGERSTTRDTAHINLLSGIFSGDHSTGDYTLPSGYDPRERPKADRWDAVDRLYDSSTDVGKWEDLNARGGNNWGTAYIQAVNPAFTSVEAADRFLKEHPDYERALIRSAQPGSIPAHYTFREGGSGTPSFMDISNSPYAINDGRGNIRILLNLVKAYREAARQQPNADSGNGQQTPNAETSVTTNTVQTPVIPEGTNVVTGPDGRQYLSSNTDRKAQTAANIGAALAAGQNPFAGARVRVHTLAAPVETPAPTPAPTPVQAPPISGTWNAPSFTQPSSGISFYNLPPGMTQEQAQQAWNATGRAAAEAYLAATGRRGENIQVSPDGSTIRLRNSRGGYTELNTALPAASQEKFDVNQITPEMRARYAQDPAMRRGLIAMQGANGRVYRAPASSSFRRSRPSATAAPVRNRARWADISVDTDNYGAFERAYADLMHRRTGGGYAQQGWQQQAADWGNRQYTNWQRVQGKTREQMSDNERRWYNAVNKHENHTLYSALQAREAEERRNDASSPQNVRSAPPSYTSYTAARSQARPVGRRGRA